MDHVRAFLIGCAIALVVVGCAGVRSGALQEEQGLTEATEQMQTSAPEATASEEARCEGTRTVDLLASSSVSSVSDSSVQPGDPQALTITNDLPGCPDKGGLLSGTDGSDKLTGEDEVRGLGGSDLLSGGRSSDTVYGGLGNDELQAGGWPPVSFYTDRSKNTLHGGPGRDFLAGAEGDDVLYGGEGDDEML